MRLVEATFSDVPALTEALTGADVAYLSSMSDAADAASILVALPVMRQGRTGSLSPAPAGQSGAQDAGSSQAGASGTSTAKAGNDVVAATMEGLARFEHQCGVITRTPSPTDRRSAQVRVNQDGYELLERTYGAVAQVLRENQDLGRVSD